MESSSMLNSINDNIILDDINVVELMRRKYKLIADPIGIKNLIEILKKLFLKALISQESWLWVHLFQINTPLLMFCLLVLDYCILINKHLGLFKLNNDSNFNLKPIISSSEYAVFSDLKKKGFYVINGFKYGSDFCYYKGKVQDHTLYQYIKMIP